MSNEDLPERSCETRTPETITEETRGQVRHSCHARRSGEEQEQIRSEGECKNQKLKKIIKRTKKPVQRPTFIDAARRYGLSGEEAHRYNVYWNGRLPFEPL